jgi:hypothetical protein
MLDLSDRFSEERVERYLILYELLNGDVGFFVKPNSSKQFPILLCILLPICICLSSSS